MPLYLIESQLYNHGENIFTVDPEIIQVADSLVRDLGIAPDVARCPELRMRLTAAIRSFLATFTGSRPQSRRVVDAVMLTASLRTRAAWRVSLERADARFTVVLVTIGASKISVIKVVREATGLGLKECKDLVEAPPGLIKTYPDKLRAQGSGSAQFAPAGLASAQKIRKCVNLVVSVTLPFSSSVYTEGKSEPPQVPPTCVGLCIKD